MSSVNLGNYSYLQKEKHIDAFRVMILCVILAVVVLIVWAYSVIFGFAPQTLPTTPTQTESVAVQKQDIIMRLQKASIQPLTKQEVSDVVKFIALSGATYTQAEKELIVKALGAKSK